MAAPRLNGRTAPSNLQPPVLSPIQIYIRAEVIRCPRSGRVPADRQSWRIRASHAIMHQSAVLVPLRDGPALPSSFRRVQAALAATSENGWGKLFGTIFVGLEMHPQVVTCEIMVSRSASRTAWPDMKIVKLTSANAPRSRLPASTVEIRRSVD